MRVPVSNIMFSAPASASGPMVRVDPLARQIAALLNGLHDIRTRNADPALEPHIDRAVADTIALSAMIGVARPGDDSTDLPVDLPVFQRLMDLAGPEMVTELLDQLILDLAAVNARILAAGPELDWPALRDQSHILIAVAGVIGARNVQTDAETLNALAHQQNEPELGLLVFRLHPQLAALIRFVQQQRTTTVAP